MKDIEIVIVVKEGRVETVYANNPALHTCVEVIDCDTQDPEEYEACKAREKEIYKDPNYEVVG